MGELWLILLLGGGHLRKLLKRWAIKYAFSPQEIDVLAKLTHGFWKSYLARSLHDPTCSRLFETFVVVWDLKKQFKEVQQ